ncbi:MAG TPA: hypothetical protein VHZ26_06635 [Caulobacteraceae bacterium]|nr:hypothetical protein [Caulobacteraceae bacterium]
MRFNSGGAVMTAGRAGHLSRRPIRPEALTSTDCPEARMAGDNNNNNNNRLR